MARQRKAKAAKDEPPRWPAFDRLVFLRSERSAAALLGITVALSVLMGGVAATLVALGGGAMALPALVGVLASLALIPIAQLLGIHIGAAEEAPFLGTTKVRTPSLSLLRMAGTMVTFLLVFLSTLILLVNPPLADYSAPVVVDHTALAQEEGTEPQVLLEVRENAAIEAVTLQVRTPEDHIIGPLEMHPQAGGLYRYTLPAGGPTGTWHYSVVATDTHGNVGRLSDGAVQLLAYRAPVITFLDSTLRVTVDDSVPPLLLTYAYDLPSTATTWYGDPSIAERKARLEAGSAIISTRGLAPGSHTVTFCAFEPGERVPVCAGPFSFVH